jgi:hypothetical protein
MASQTAATCSLCVLKRPKNDGTMENRLSTTMTERCAKVAEVWTAANVHVAEGKQIAVEAVARKQPRRVGNLMQMTVDADNLPDLARHAATVVKVSVRDDKPGSGDDGKLWRRL